MQVHRYHPEGDTGFLHVTSPYLPKEIRDSGYHGMSYRSHLPDTPWVELLYPGVYLTLHSPGEPVECESEVAHESMWMVEILLL